MPEKKTIKAAQKDKHEGKSASTQAGEFVREEMHHIREGKHGARSPEQAIAIGLSKARKAGVDLPSQDGDGPSKKRGTPHIHEPKKPSSTRSRAAKTAMKREGKRAASHSALSEHAKKAAKSRTAAERSASAEQAAETKGPKERSEAAKKAARTRARNKK